MIKEKLNLNNYIKNLFIYIIIYMSYYSISGQFINKQLVKETWINTVSTSTPKIFACGKNICGIASNGQTYICKAPCDGYTWEPIAQNELNELNIDNLYTKITNLTQSNQDCEKKYGNVFKLTQEKDDNIKSLEVALANMTSANNQCKTNVQNLGTSTDVKVLALQQQLNETKASASQLQQQLNEKNASALQLERQLNEKNASASQLEKQLNEKNASASQLEKQLNEKNARASYLEFQLNEKNASASQLEIQLNEKNASALELERQLKENKLFNNIIEYKVPGSAYGNTNSLYLEDGKGEITLYGKVCKQNDNNTINAIWHTLSVTNASSNARKNNAPDPVAWGRNNGDTQDKINWNNQWLGSCGVAATKMTSNNNQNIPIDKIKLTDILLQVDKKFKPVKNTILSSAIMMPLNWTLSFDIMPLSKITNWGNIFHFSDINNDRGTRFPSLFFFPNSTRLHIPFSDINDDIITINMTEDLSLNTYHHVILSCNNNRITLSVNAKVIESSNRKVTGKNYDGVYKLWCGNAWDDSANCEIANFKFGIFGSIDLTPKNSPLISQANTNDTTNKLTTLISQANTNTNYELYTNKDHPGDDILCYQDNTKPEVCKSKCDSDTNCVGYNYVKPNGPWGNVSGCCIKNKNTRIVDSNNVDFYSKKM
jgi:hypothetical protein